MLSNNRILIALLILTSCKTQFSEDAQEDHLQDEIGYEEKELLFEDSFENGMSNWIVEKEEVAGSDIHTAEGKLVIDVGGGATIWLNEKLEGNVLIEYNRKVVVEDGENDRLSDLNQFWMATDPQKENVFTRSGSFREYDSLKMYYAGIGGNRNTTTRFRKYPGNGERTLIHDFKEKDFLLKPNKDYLIQTIVYNGITKVFVNGQEYFSYEDEDPLTEGYFGFRTVQSHQEIDNFKVFELD